MSDATPFDPDLPGAAKPPRADGPLRPAGEQDVEEADWHVRLARPADASGIAAVVRELLFELGGKPTSGPAMQQAVRELVEDVEAGALLVADAGGRIVGFLGASWQSAVRIPGRYGLIQELWVHPVWRSHAIGAELVGALCDLAEHQGIGRIEVGLPSERFPNVEATTSFYETCGFSAIGLRMRKLLP